ncbi:unnamed protein product [Protopolystoma xenopodis]|uniref:Uncharacterized protein n=1 Tax=Protopolystoma xenopodis TaxID=117903 RepID=A0A448XJW0_9PLAT|nr:unnamed protein product [Protopolystoma xenopodis]
MFTSFSRFIFPIYVDLTMDPSSQQVFYRVLRRPDSTTLGTKGSGEDISTLENRVVVVDQATCRQMRHNKSIVDSIRRGMDCGISLNAPTSTSKSYIPIEDLSDRLWGDWQTGDLVQCFTLSADVQSIDWPDIAPKLLSTTDEHQDDLLTG